MKLPKHKCGLYLEHNAYKDYYDTIERAHEDLDRDKLTLWANDESRKRSLETKEVWTLHWYPNTPIGFYKIAAPTLEELLSFAEEIEKEDE